MSTILASDIPARVLTVLGDYLPAELDLIDAQRGGDATDNPAVYLPGPRPSQSVFPAITADTKRIEPIFEHVVDSPGVLEYYAHTEVAAHVQSGGEDYARMRDLAERYAAGILRVLCFKKNGLETSGDPTRFSLVVEPDGDITMVDEEQSSGALMRSARVPVRVRMYEAMT